MRSPSLSRRKLLFEQSDVSKVPLQRNEISSSSSSSSSRIVRNRVVVPIVTKTEPIDDHDDDDDDDVSPSAPTYTDPKKSIKGRRTYEGPFPSFTRPSPYDCMDVCKKLWHLHGPLQDYAKHRDARINNSNSQLTSYLASLEDIKIQHQEKKPKIEVEDCLDDNAEEVIDHRQQENRIRPQSVLDSLVATILSQSTTEGNSRRAFAQLKHRFPTWEEVYKADPKEVEDTIRCGGLAGRKASRILNILSILQREQGKLCLEYVRSMTTSRIKLELSRFKGVGPKTAACVLMFHLQKDEFPVDTHVFRITKMLGWVPENADREKAYLHLNDRIPNDLKFDLHCLFVTHGRRCPHCAKGGRTQQKADGLCPLISTTMKSIRYSK